MKIKRKIHTKYIFVLVFIGVIFTFFSMAMAILEDGKLDRNVFGAGKMQHIGIYIADIPVWVDVANTNETRKTGLSGRESLQEGHGMLFVFSESGQHGIWMKDMNFPIDILWVDESYKIVGIKRDVKPESFPKIFQSEKDSLYIIEVNTGFVNTNDIKIGDKVILQIL